MSLLDIVRNSKISKTLILFTSLTTFYMFTGCKEEGPTAPEEAIVTGTVNDSQTNSPLPGAIVSIDNLTSTTGNDGVYNLDKVPTGQKTLKAEREEYTPFSATINVNDGTNNYDITLVKLITYALYGKVTNPGNEPISGVLVQTISQNDTTNKKTDHTDNDGNYQITNLAPGNYVIKAFKEYFSDFSSNILIGNTNREFNIEIAEIYTSKIAFVSSRNGSNNNDYNGIFIMDFDGENQNPIPNLPSGQFIMYNHPSWSPDGSKIVFVYVNTMGHSSDLYSIEMGGGDLSKLTDGIDVSCPNWSPDGSKISYSSYDYSFKDRVFIKNANSYSNGTFLVEGHDPSWSPDGSKIVFDTRYLYEGIHIINVNGQGEQQLTQDMNDLAPSWSPDGSKIAFQSDRDEHNNQDIYIMNTDGTNIQRLTYDQADDRAPTWSPYSSKIAFRSDRDGTWQIYVMNTDGSNVTRLTSAGQNINPAWSRLIQK